MSNAPRPARWCAAAMLAGACVVGALAPSAGAQSPAPSSEPVEPRVPVKQMTVAEADRERTRLTKVVFEAFDQKRYADAVKLLEQLIPLDADNSVHWYNLGCALALSGEPARAMQMLEQAIERGFSDRAKLDADPDLASLRSDEKFKTLLASWPARRTRAEQRRLDRLIERYAPDTPGSAYSMQRDEPQRLLFIHAFDPDRFQEAKRELDVLARWWADNVLPEADQAAALSGERYAKSPIVSVILPSRRDYAEWAIPRFGSRWDRVGGSYNHGEHTLVSMDLGPGLRHEFWHVLHWRDMDLRGQRHPIWIMEGLCSLVEDVDIAPPPGNDVMIRHSWRTNTARRLARGSGGLTPWSTLFSMSNQAFMRQRPLAMYAQSRAVFEFLVHRGKLREWYSLYVASFATDATGALAMEQAFDQPLKDVERLFRLWMRDLPEVPEQVGRMSANLPVDLGPGTGDGVVVLMDDFEELLTGAPPANRPAKRTLRGSLKMNDVITSINGVPVRDLSDVARVLAKRESGEVVEVGFASPRRGGPSTAAKLTTSVTLIPPE
jgi:PDZ domain